MRDLVAAGPPTAAEADEADVVETFIRGRAAMAMAPFSTFRGVADEMGSTVVFAPLPGTGDAKRACLVQGYGMAVASRISAERRREALAFLRWFLSDATQRRWVARTGLSFDRVHTQTAAYRGSNGYADAYSRTLPYLQRYWDVPVSDALGALVQRYVGDAVDGYTDPAKALDALAEQSADLLRDAGLLTEY
jgi:multiple sugar transport system substrate-binding protein